MEDQVVLLLLQKPPSLLEEFVLNHNTSNKTIESSILTALIQMLNETNELVKVFHMVRDSFSEDDIHQMRLRRISSRTTNGRECNLPNCPEIATIYPLLFPYGEDGFRLDILCRTDRNTTPASIGKRIISPLNAMVIYRWAGYPDLFITFICNAKWTEIENTTISAEIPDVDKDKIAYDAVKQYMVHGPCGFINPKASCMINNKCIKSFSKKLCKETSIDEDGFSNGLKLDNRFIVPYNMDLLVKYQVHINVKWCNLSRSIKYLFKYINKGIDYATIKSYLDCKYVFATKACWRIFWFDIHYLEPAVKSFHLGNEQSIIFEDSDDLDNVFNRPNILQTKFTEWTKANVIFYLRMLLNIVKGRRSFEEIRTIDNILYPSLEWHETLNQASQWASGKQLRELFVTILIFCEVANLYKLWIGNWVLLSEDILHHQRKVFHCENMHLTKIQIKTYAICDIEQLLVRNGRSLREFENMPYPDILLFGKNKNRLLKEELDYNRVGLKEEHDKLFVNLNVEQTRIYDSVIESVNGKTDDFFFVYGHGGKIVLAGASSGIMTLLLPGGRTVYSKSQIPINLSNNLTCSFKQGSQLIELMVRTSLIIWDEAPMAHRNCFEAVDRSLRNILQFTNINIVLSCDFRQILLVVSKDKREQIVGTTINRSSLWRNCVIFTMTQNMRLNQNMGIGDGDLSCVESKGMIEIPPNLIVQSNDHPIADIVNATYSDLRDKYNNSRYVGKRAILAPTKDVVQDINDYMIDQLIDLDEQLSKWVVDAKIMTRTHVGKKVFIPHIILSPFDSKLSFILKRRQLPISICFAMTINKSQGQTLEHVGLFLEKTVFSHGQLYI
ncbi:hypothetical protein I3842_16G058500 [Carya illinoinensis]|uniref:ATP-dependent DNA helicase n=1 Tax=Carya illinoinensis TaxID=32201 RepID=A0A922A0A3_CARIL|nr:hypothetical protein I3842_16G058500 [Carya illinoinensis]